MLPLFFLIRQNIMSWAKLELIAKLEMIIMSQFWEIDKVTDKLVILQGAWCRLESLFSFLSLDLCMGFANSDSITFCVLFFFFLREIGI